MEITPRTKRFGMLLKHSNQGYILVPPLKRSDNSIALDDVELAECLADSIESQCSHVSLTYDILHIHRIEEQVWHKASLERKEDLPFVFFSEVQMLIKSLKIRKASHLNSISKTRSNAFFAFAYW
ncbi:hypothetical protein EVAR_47144_1 [Eumeta japonica]|uniref:Uncharacterized protein n=1 Tax=Eumeta variegata TaxID=151549 RepID=A0A4C1XYZ4_EUMVA|nr:hypothetical protein EVAR_47144_1 [Eumeta japonica]